MVMAFALAASTWIAGLMRLAPELNLFGYGSFVLSAGAKMLVACVCVFFPLALLLEWVCGKLSRWFAVLPTVVLVAALAVLGLQIYGSEETELVVYGAAGRTAFWMAGFAVYWGILCFIRRSNERKEAAEKKKAKKKPKSKKKKRK